MVCPEMIHGNYLSVYVSSHHNITFQLVWTFDQSNRIAAVLVNGGLALMSQILMRC